MNNSFSVTYASGQISGCVTWRCPSNIALIKYWGKRERQLPSNPSLSFTLTNSAAETTVEYEYIDALVNPASIFTVNGKMNPKLHSQISAYIENRVLDIPDLTHLRLNINTKITYNSNAGLGSSIPIYSSLALCLCSIEEIINGSVSGSMDFFKKASYMARLGSGSACRSIYGGFSVWGDSEFYSEYTNLYAQPLNFDIHPEFKNLQVAILVLSSDDKIISDSSGHDLMKGHPYASGRYNQAQKNLNSLIISLRTGDLDLFTTIVENEALSLQALIMSSGAGLILFKPETIHLIEKIKHFRKTHQIPIYFTMGTGPNIMLIFSEKYSDKINPFIENELKPHCINNQVIMDKVGSGPEKL